MNKAIKTFNRNKLGQIRANQLTSAFSEQVLGKMSCETALLDELQKHDTQISRSILP